MPKKGNGLKYIGALGLGFAGSGFNEFSKRKDKDKSASEWFKTTPLGKFLNSGEKPASEAPAATAESGKPAESTQVQASQPVSSDVATATPVADNRLGIEAAGDPSGVTSDGTLLQRGEQGSFVDDFNKAPEYSPPEPFTFKNEENMSDWG